MHYNADNKSFHHHLHPLYVVSVNNLHNVYNKRNTRQISGVSNKIEQSMLPSIANTFANRTSAC